MSWAASLRGCSPLRINGYNTSGIPIVLSIALRTSAASADTGPNISYLVDDGRQARAAFVSEAGSAGLRLTYVLTRGSTAQA